MPNKIHFAAFVANLSLLAVTSASAADWLQFGYDAAHSGNNIAENTITAANASQIAPLFSAAVVLPAKVDGAPVYASNIATAGGVRNLLFLFGSDGISDFSASHGTLMAIDAADGSVVWTKSTDGGPGNSSQHATSSPAIDAAKEYVYSFGLDGYVHKYRIGDGVETLTPGPTGWPQAVTLKPNSEKVASSLTIVNTDGASYLHAVTNGYNGDGGDYQGHLVSIDLGSGTQTVFNAMCSTLSTLLANGGCSSGREGGIWGRGGATFDAATQRIYLTTGNGQFKLDSTHSNWGDSVLAFGADGSGAGNGKPLDSYTPASFQGLQNTDADLGSTSPAILPAPSDSNYTHLGLQIAKDSCVRLINLDDMSGTGASGHSGGELQQIALPNGGDNCSSGNDAGGNEVKPQPAVWVNPADGSTWTFIANDVGFTAYQLVVSAGTPSLVQKWTTTDGGTSPVVANNVLIYASSNRVRALDPVSGNSLWSTAAIGSLHWQGLIVVDGAIYIADNSGKLWKFGIQQTELIFKDGFDG